jgi:hypothetical protein
MAISYHVTSRAFFLRSSRGALSQGRTGARAITAEARIDRRRVAVPISRGFVEAVFETLALGLAAQSREHCGIVAAPMTR